MEAVVELEQWRQLVVLVPLGVLLAAAAGFDWRDKKIPNELTYSGIVVGVVCASLAFGLAGLWAALIAVVSTFVIGLLLISFTQFGGGDVKLLMGVGAFLGLSGLGEVFFYAIIAGSIFGLVQAAMTGYLREMLGRIFRYLRGLVRQVAYRTSQVGEELETDERSKIPFAVPILAGGVLAYSEAMWGWPGLLGWYLSHL